jgi:Spy/CpxP family protein refolding chaperone
VVKELASIEFVKEPVMRRSFYVLAVIGAAVLAALTGTSPASAQSGGSEPGAAKKLTGRLPKFYDEVLTEEQKDQIFKLQADYKAKMDDLKAQYQKLDAEKKAKIEAIPTAEQKEKIKKLTDDAAKARAAARAAAMAERAKKSGRTGTKPRSSDP